MQWQRPMARTKKGAQRKKAAAREEQAAAEAEQAAARQYFAEERDAKRQRTDGTDGAGAAAGVRHRLALACRTRAEGGWGHARSRALRWAPDLAM